MNILEQQEYFKEFVSMQSNLILKKGNDYSIDGDRLSNFKLAGNIVGISPEMNCLSLIATKVARLGVLLSKKQEPNNESVKDSIIDLANYSVLLAMIIQEKSEDLPF